MAVSVSLGQFQNWLVANDALPVGLSYATPSSGELEILQLCLDAVVSQIETAYNIPDPQPDVVEVAAYIQAARIYRRRLTPDGVFAVSDFGTIRVTAFDADVANLLGPYKAWRFG